MSKGGFRQPLSVRLRAAADHADEVGRYRQVAEGWIRTDTPGGPMAAMMREAADLAERYENAERGVWNWKARGLVEFEPSAGYYNGMRMRLVPEDINGS